MTKRKPEDVEEGFVKDRRINFIHINDISIVDKATAAFQKGISCVKLCTDSKSGASLWVKPTVINATFGPITQSDDVFSINKNKKLIFVTKHLSSVQEVTRFVTSVQNANVRLIDTNIVTKCIIRDVDMDLFIEDIAAELTNQNIAASKIVRFKKKGTSDPIPIVPIEEIGRTNRSEIRIGRLIFKAYKFIENTKLCYKCLKFGHTQIRCTNDKKCKNCGGSHNECSDVSIKCFHCGQAHDALSKECSFFLIEKEIINLVRDKGISCNEASKKVNLQTYAQIVRDHSSDKNSVKSGKEIADLREALKELSNIVSSLIPKVNDIAKLQEVNRQSVGRIVEIQINLDRQVEENLNLKKHIEAQRATIESLQSKIAVLESNLEYNSIPSPIVGDDQWTLADLNQFRVVSDGVISDFGADRQNSSKGGLIIATNHDILAQQISLSLPPSEVESLTVKIWLGPNSETPIMIINIYAPGGKFRTNWLESLSSQISSPFVILGDSKIHHLAGSSHTSTDAVSVLDWIGIRHMCVLNMNRFTRFQGTHSPSLLDLTICSADIVNNISLEVSHDMYDSDHCPILLSLCNSGIKSKVTRKCINWGQFSERVNENLRMTDIISSIEDLTHIFKVSSGSSSYSFTRSAHQHSPWWDVKCNYLKALKRKLLRKVKSYPSRANWTAYKNMAGTLRKYAKERKEKFWDNTYQEAASSHQVFCIVKALLNKDGSPCVSNLVLSSGTSLTAPLAQANAIAVSLIKRPPEERIPLDFFPDSKYEF
ncbi:hypothetical protein AVEN_23615-1 [Araneus ventricosus]|uniref:Endonuclease/exonuclease/phosphatase domain-containing protein n=1 Tax=Araneus ventricosus TaxID=182803 RepID=A0A4Y2BH18_ARAVE|nr:hypothetical protein AVEN_23615-1 [Araneus ventricosus]